MKKIILITGSALVLLYIGSVLFTVEKVNETDSASVPVQAQTITTPSVVIDRLEVERLVNEYRTDRQLAALTTDPTLRESSAIRSNEIAACGQDCWSHTRPDGSEFFTSYGGYYEELGENLAECFDTPSQVVQAWHNSPTHREILNKAYTHIGVSVATPASGCNVITLHVRR